jgi:two-component system sensor histidine kinase RegB
MRAVPDRNRVNVWWLLRLRWAEVAGQASTVLVTWSLLGVALPLAELTAVIAIGLVSNLVLAWYFRDPRPVHEWQLAAVMALDTALLAVMLYFTGGPLNPFGFLYLVQIALATVLVHAAWTWTLVGLSLGSFGLLLLRHRPLAVSDDARMYGMWVALAVASAFIVHFLLRITTALSQREHELFEARSLAARQERLASLATMAAGAAHELSTPLGTVALVAKELERALARLGDTQLVEDARLIREQVGRCKVILDQMAGGAGASAGEGVERVTIAALLDEACANVRPMPPVYREIADEVGALHVRLPPRAVGQALRSLITNAQDASPTAEQVTVAASRRGDRLILEVIDRGPGMPPEILARVGEPFYTTKAPGRGMGLGLFLARAVIEGVGGSMQIDTHVGEGTRMVVTLPTDVSPGKPGDQSRAAPIARSLLSTGS